MENSFKILYNKYLRGILYNIAENSILVPTYNIQVSTGKVRNWYFQNEFDTSLATTKS